MTFNVQNTSKRSCKVNPWQSEERCTSVAIPYTGWNYLRTDVFLFFVVKSNKMNAQVTWESNELGMFRIDCITTERCGRFSHRATETVRDSRVQKFHT